MNFGVSLSRNFTVASILMTSTYVIITVCCAASSDGTFYNFSVTFNVKKNCDRNYANLLNFVKVMLKIQAVPFTGHGVYSSSTRKQLTLIRNEGNVDNYIYLAQ